MAKKQKEITGKEFNELLLAHPELRKNVIDIRPPQDVKVYGKIINSTLIEMNEFRKMHRKILKKKETYYIIDKDGSEAKTLAMSLRMFRRYHAIYVVGGYRSYLDAKMGRD